MNISVSGQKKSGFFRSSADFLFRACLVFVTLLSVLLEISECLLPESENILTYIIFTALAVSVFGTFTFRSLKTALTGLVAAAVLWLTLFAGWRIRVSDVFASGVSTFWARFMETISDMGYVALDTFRAGSYFGSGRAVIVTFGVALGILFSIALSRRIRIFPYIAGILIIVIPFLVFSLPASVGVFLLLCVSVTAVMCAVTCDRRGGDYLSVSSTGVAALALAGAVAVIPASLVSANQGRIPVISEVVEYVRDEMTALFSGDSGRASQGVSLAEQAHSVEPNARRYTGRRMMTVISEYDATVYLSEWAGAYYIDNAWYAETGDRYSLLDETEIPITFFMECGLVAGSEDYMKEMGLTDGAVIGVSTYISGYSVWLPFQTYDITMRNGDKTFFAARGVMQTEKRIRRKTYSVEAWLQTDNSAERMKKIDEYTARLSTLDVWSHLGYYIDGYTQSDVPESVVDISGQILELYWQKYGTGLFESYVRPYSFFEPESWRAGYAEEVGRLVEIIAEFLDDRCEYTLTPPKATAKDAVDDFLYNSRQGYCVQFATAAALTLRYLGIPTRYVEGYVANNFKESSSGYICNVLDRNAHAWIEVWLPYYGWRLFEVTPGAGGAPQPPVPVTTAAVTETETEPGPVTGPEHTETARITTDVPSTNGGNFPHVTTGPKTPSDPEKSGTFNVLLALIAVAAAAALLVIRYKSSVKKADSFLSKAMKTEKAPGAAEKRELVKYLRFSLAAYGALPAGQLPSEYQKLLDRKIGMIYPATSEAVGAMESLLYGNGPDGSGQRVLAGMCTAMRRGARRQLSKPKYLFERYILCRI